MNPIKKCRSSQNCPFDLDPQPMLDIHNILSTSLIGFDTIRPEAEKGIIWEAK